MLDPDRSVEKRHNRNGWPFLMLVGPEGKVLHTAVNLIDREMPKLDPLLAQALGRSRKSKTVIRDGVPYMPATLKRSGEQQKSKRRDRFGSLVCGPDGRVYLALTSNRSGNSDVFLRVFDGKRWSADRPVAATAADEYDVAVLLDKAGRLWLSWTSNADGKNYNIFAATVGDPSKPIQPTQLTRADDDAMHARLACDRSGRVWVTYYKWQKMGDLSRDKEVYVRRHDGKAWSAQVQVSPTDVPSYEDHTDPAIAPCGKGVVVAWSWDYHRPKGYPRTAREPTIFIRKVAADLTLGDALPLSGDHIDTTPALAAGPDGRIWCAWDSLAWSGFDRAYRKTVRSCSLQADTGRSDTAPVAAGQMNVCSPHLAVSPQGAITLIWCEKASADAAWVLKHAKHRPGTRGWSPAQVLEAKRNPRFPSSAYDKHGNLWIAYSHQTSLGREITVKKLPPAGN